jgi:uncharacterized cupredoxin-like copper-binding protein
LALRSLVGLLTLTSLALSGSASLADAPAPAAVPVVLANFSFTPSDLHLTADKPVTLQFVNEGSGGHNFVAPEFFAAAAMDEATRARVGEKGVVELGKGESADIALTPKAGSYKVKCTHFLHAGFGMTGTITVG